MKSRQSVGIAIKQTTFFRCSDHRVSETASQPHVLSEIKVSPSGPLGGPASFIALVLLPKLKKRGPIDKAKVQSPTSSYQRADFKVSRDILKGFVSGFGCAPGRG